MQKNDRINRVEYPITPGMPDVNCCLFGIGEFWIETKTPIEPKRASTPLFGSNHRVTIDQINWHRAQYQAGGASYILIDTDKRLLIVAGRLIEQINNMTIAELCVQSEFVRLKPMRKNEWKKLRQCLKHNHLHTK